MTTRPPHPAVRRTTRPLREDAALRDARAFRAALKLVDDTRERFALNVSEELALEALAYRLADRA